jgi:hypothetical protein
MLIGFNASSMTAYARLLALALPRKIFLGCHFPLAIKHGDCFVVAKLISRNPVEEIGTRFQQCLSRSWELKLIVRRGIGFLEIGRTSCA